MHYEQYYLPFPQYQTRPITTYNPINITTFGYSVAAFQKIANEAITLLSKLAEPKFAHSLMTAAQAGNKMEVNRLIRSIGISTPVSAAYTPTGILLTIHAQAQGSQCCTLTMYLRWGQ